MTWKHAGPPIETALPPRGSVFHTAPRPPTEPRALAQATVPRAEGVAAPARRGGTRDSEPFAQAEARGAEAVTRHANVRTDLIDGCGRRIDRLRLSVTPACDLQCVYCRPGKEALDVDRLGLLRDEQRVEFVRFLYERYGLTHVRITGGEPLLHRGVVSLVAAIRRISENLNLAMTTSGRLLYRFGFELRNAGLDRLNVSLDSLDPRRYHRITGGNLNAVLEGLKSARIVGFPPPKINTVVLRGMNDDELIELTRWAMARGSEIRFLEAMPIGPAAETNRRAFVSAAWIKSALAAQFALEPIPGQPGDTATLFRASDATTSGIVGLISPVTQPFCGGCRRIRLTASGQLFPCLLDNRHVDLTPGWNGDGLDRTVADRLIRNAVATKQPQGTHQETPMVSIGG